MGNKKLKITFLSMYSGRINRGVESFVNEIANKLTILGHEITLFQTGAVLRNNNFNARQINLKINWNKKNKKNTFIRKIFLDYQSRLIARFSLKTIRDIRENKPDIVVPLNGGWQTLLIRIVTWSYGGKMVVIGESGIGWDDRINLYCFPNIFIGISKKARTWAKKVNPRIKSYYIPNGVDISRFTPKGKKYMHNLNKPIILCVGALVSEKQIENTIKAVAGIEKASLLIVGDGPLKEELLILGKGLLKNEFKIISAKHSQMPEIYRSADVFTLVPATSEAFGIVYIEAMASGLPVVATNDSIRKDIIGNGGILVDPGNIEEYTEALKKAIEKDWKERPRKQAEKYSWDKIAKQYEEMFLELVE